MDDDRFEDGRVRPEKIQSVVLKDGRTYTYKHILDTFNKSRITRRLYD